MNLRHSAGASLSRFAHLTGLSAKPNAKAKAEDGEDDKKKDDEDPAAEDDEKDDKKAKKAEDDGDGEMDAEADDGEGDGEDDEKDKPDAKKGASASIRAARLAERARCAAIFASKAATGRVALACQLAFTTSLSASQAIGILAASPAAPSANAGLGARMAGVPNIQVGDDATGDAPTDARAEAKQNAARTLAAARAAGAKY